MSYEKQETRGTVRGSLRPLKDSHCRVLKGVGKDEQRWGVRGEGRNRVVASIVPRTIFDETRSSKEDGTGVTT